MGGIKRGEQMGELVSMTIGGRAVSRAVSHYSRQLMLKTIAEWTGWGMG